MPTAFPVVETESDPVPQRSPREIYESRVTCAIRVIRALKIAFNRISNARMLAFVGVLVCVFVGVYWPHGPAAGAAWLSAGLASLGAFAFLLFKHAGIQRELLRAEGMQRINQQALARLDRDWPKLPLPPAPAAVAGDPLGLDLDLFGRGSVFHLLCTAGTPQGRRILAGMLLPPPGAVPPRVGDIQARQEAVAEFAASLELRQNLQLGGAEFASGINQPGREVPDENPLLEWMASHPFLLARPGLVWAARILPGLIVLATILWLKAEPRWLGALLLLLAFRWVWMARAAGRVVGQQLDAACGKERNLRGYGELFALLAAWEPRSPELRRLVERLRGAEAAMNALDVLVGLAAIRTTPANPLAQWVFQWDFHALYLMECWQARHGAQVRGWFEALGEVEALASLATLRFDQPDWSFPASTEELRIEARGLGHPLLAEGSRVANDVTLGPPGTFLLVTGSNMSGKSTLLRTLGVNVMLARAGAPVCAGSLRLPPGIVLATSLRVQDSLQEGVSFFMAELRRLAGVVESADAIPNEPGRPVLLYLLDEILRGTNTQERGIIVGKVVTHLLGCRAIGAISTHDLSLAEVETLAKAAQTVHFREEFTEGVDGATMRFDYRMRPGLATTTNALKLLEVIGLKL